LFINNINSLAKQGIEHYGSEALGVEVRVDSVALSLFGGSGTISGLRVANPKDFQAADAFSLERIHLAVDPASLTQQVIQVKDITVDGATLLVEQKRKAGNNLDVLRKNAERYAGADQTQTPEDQTPARRRAIKAFTFLDASVEVSAEGLGEQRVSLPDIRLTDIGDARSGVSIGEAVGRMLKPVVSAALKDALKQKVEGTIKGGLDQVLDSNDKLRSLKGLIDKVQPPPGQ